MTSANHSFGIASAFSLLSWLLLGSNTPGSAQALPVEVLTTTPASEVAQTTPDRKSTRLNSSHLVISYAVFCLKKKKQKIKKKKEKK